MDISASHDRTRPNAPSPAKSKRVANINNEDALQTYRTMLEMDLEKGSKSFEQQLSSDFYWHNFRPALHRAWFLTTYSTAQYWFVASLANGLLWVQIVLGAALTALGATNAPGSKKAIIYLGAASTIISGLLTYFKSRNQPNRARQLRQALRGVRDEMDQGASELYGEQDAAVGRQKALSVFKKYNEALKTAEINYPDLWASLKDLERKHSRSNSVSEPGPRKPVQGRTASRGLNSTLVASSSQAEPKTESSGGPKASASRASHRLKETAPAGPAHSFAGRDKGNINARGGPLRSDEGKSGIAGKADLALGSSRPFAENAEKSQLQQDVSSWRKSVMPLENRGTEAQLPKRPVHTDGEVQAEKDLSNERGSGGWAHDAVSEAATESTASLHPGHGPHSGGGSMLS